MAGTGNIKKERGRLSRPLLVRIAISFLIVAVVLVVGMVLSFKIGDSGLTLGQLKGLGILLTVLAAVLLCLMAFQWIVLEYLREQAARVQKETEAAIEQIKREQEYTDRLKVDFLELASHELRGPVNAVSASLQTAEMALRDKLDEDEMYLLEVAGTGTRRLVDLVDNLLDLTRIESTGYEFEVKEIDVRELVSNAAEMYEPLAGEKEISIVTDLPDEEITAVIDSAVVNRVLDNLLSNAIKFTVSGEVRLGVEVLGDTLRFSVRDTGAGIPDEFQAEVFEKFAKLDRPTGHTRSSGMGLALSKGLIEAQGGRIWFESEEDMGSDFYFEIERFQGSASNNR